MTTTQPRLNTSSYYGALFPIACIILGTLGHWARTTFGLALPTGAVIGVLAIAGILLPHSSCRRGSRHERSAPERESRPVEDGRAYPPAGPTWSPTSERQAEDGRAYPPAGSAH